METPKLKYKGQCKVCKLQKVNQFLFNELHSLRFSSNPPKTLEGVTEYINQQIIEKGYDKKLLLNFQNLDNHFNKHIPIDVISDYKLRLRVDTSSREDKEQNTPATLEYMDKIVMEKVSVYDKLEDLFLLIDEKFKAFDTAQNGAINPLNIDAYGLLFRELRACLTDLHKIKQNEQLIRVIIGSALQHYTLTTVQGILKELSGLKTSLKVYVNDPDTVERLVSNLQSNLGDLLVLSSQSTLDEIKATYKIK